MKPATRSAEGSSTEVSAPAGFDEAAERTAAMYAPSGKFAVGYARGKLRHDPVFRQLVQRAPLAEPVLDLGCGRGQTELLLSALFGELEMQGFDWDEAKVELARAAAARQGANSKLRFDAGDLRTMDYPRAGTILMLDVLHYNPIETQNEMLRRAAAALLPRGRLFVREVDASGGLRAKLNIWQERLGCFFGLNRGATLCFRSADSIESVMRGAGLETRRDASWEGTPLANVLIEGRLIEDQLNEGGPLQL